MCDVTTDGSMRLKYFNIMADNGYLTVSFYGDSIGDKKIKDKEWWTLENVDKYA